MKQILLSGGGWKTEGDFYAAFFKGVQAPDWHGKNFDALEESIAASDINGITVPYEIVITGFGEMSPEAKAITKRLKDLIEDLKSKGTSVDIQVLDNT